MNFMTPKRVKDLQRIMLKDYNKEMTYSEAETFGKDIVELFDLLAKADSKP